MDRDVSAEQRVLENQGGNEKVADVFSVLFMHLTSMESYLTVYNSSWEDNIYWAWLQEQRTEGTLRNKKELKDHMLLPHYIK